MMLRGAYVIPFQVSQPNFVTNNSVQAAGVVLLTNDSLRRDISGKIVLIVKMLTQGLIGFFAHGILWPNHEIWRR